MIVFHLLKNVTGDTWDIYLKKKTQMKPQESKTVLSEMKITLSGK